MLVNIFFFFFWLHCVRTHAYGSTGEVGNGRATAILLARQGAKVALVDYNVDWAQETKRMIDFDGGQSVVIQADVTEEESCKKAVEQTVKAFGTVNILVNIGKPPKRHSGPETDNEISSSRSWRCYGRRYET